MDTTRPILVLTASAGAGHTMAARAVAEALTALRPEATVEVHDVLVSTTRFFRWLYARGYSGLVNHAPALMRKLYEAMDRAPSAWNDGWRIPFQDASARGTRRLLRRKDPQLIVNTHFLPAELVARMRRRGELDCPQATVTTDFETFRLWVQPPTERYFTATQDGASYLTAWGAPVECIRVTGIPVRAAFGQPLDRTEMRRRHALEPDRPVILVLSGPLATGPVHEYVRQLAGLRNRPQVVVVTGRNERLRARLEPLARELPGVRVLGFTDRMHEWMRAADLAISKPGGLTSSEALACGLPLVVVNPIPGHEERNSDYLLERGAAIRVNHPRLLGPRVGRLLSNPARLARMREAALAAGRPAAAEQIAREVLGLIGLAPAIPPAPADRALATV